MWISESANGDFSSIAIHPSSSIVASSSNDGTVSLYDEDLVVCQSIVLKKDGQVNGLQWHPTRKFLAVSWTNGTVGLWCLDSNSSFREGNVHHAPISCIVWSPNGNRLITGDEEGGVVVWKIDHRGKLATMSQYRLRGAIDHIVFKPIDKRARESRTKDKDCPPFFVGTRNGTIFFADDIGHCTECTTLSSKIHLLHYHESRDLLLALTEDMVLSHFVHDDGKLTLESSWLQVKLGGSTNQTGNTLACQWIDTDLLAYSVNKSPPRIWDSANEETIVLDRPELAKMSYTCLTYSKRNNILVVATESCHVILWQRFQSHPLNTWEPLHKIEITGSIERIYWGITGSTLAIKKSNGFQLLSEQSLQSASSGLQVQVSQVSSHKVMVESFGKPSETFESAGKIRGLEVSSSSIGIWTGQNFDIYTLDGLKAKFFNTLSCPNPLYSLSEKFAYVAAQITIQILSIPTGIKTTVLLPNSDGDIIALSSVASRLFILTRTWRLKVFDITIKDTKLISENDIEAHFMGNFQSITMKPNSNGSMIAFVGCGESSVIKVYSSSNNRMFVYECGRIKSFVWDQKDPRVLVAQTIGNENNKNIHNQLLSFFATENEFVFKDTTQVPQTAEKLSALYLPYQIFYKKTEFKAEPSEHFSKNIIKEYNGIDPNDEVIVKTITEFCCNLATGDIDDAIKVVKLIKNDAVWENMAQVCIKMRRMKLAILCMGKLKNAKALRTLSHLKKSNDANAISAHLAIHLGLYEEAQDIWTETKNFGGLSTFYQASGKWEKAIETAAAKDRPSLPVTYFNFAKHLEEIGDITGAIAAYEKTNASKAQIPRMMLNHKKDLQAYVDVSTEQEIKKWWAENAESHGDAETALKYYEQVNDVFSIVRVHCLSGNMKQARIMADAHPECLAAFYFIAREYDQDSKWHDAIAYYSKAKCFSNAIRIAKENKIDKELMQLALQSQPNHMEEVAVYFESLEQYDKAITLYSKSGNIKQAFDLCFKTKNIFLLETIVAQLNPEKDSEVLQQASVFLSENGSHEIALKLLLLTQNFDQVNEVYQTNRKVLDICEKQEINITEDLVDKFQSQSNSGTINPKIFIRLASLCFNQGSYHLACKCYTLGGDRLKAMGALLKSGDNEKIIMFASNYLKLIPDVSKNADIFIIAANYLQSLNWINDTNIMRVIIQFYTKAKSYVTLSRFYESCAQIEIDEYQNYEKALSALNEAEKALSKEKSAISLDMIRHKQSLVTHFIQAHRHAAQNEVAKCERICGELLNQNDIDSIIRVGDILGLLIETSYANGDLDKAKELLNRLKQRLAGSVNVEYYVDAQICKLLSPPQDTNIEESIEENFD
ncbi:hypothetical protein BC833DRAFT_654604 [Globomyces pollinis-pini]|nr:hypothetical protein BC833DRAFT_654604 [Globomyces pollinis-pini]